MNTERNRGTTEEKTTEDSEMEYPLVAYTVDYGAEIAEIISITESEMGDDIILPEREFKQPRKFPEHHNSPSLEATHLYLNELREKELLSKEEEVTLGRKIQKGIKAEAELKENPENENVLESLIAEGLEAQGLMTEANLRLVVSIAKKYKLNGVEFNDLVQEGNIGLMKAVKRFDPEKGFRFSTYATWWIKQSVRRSLSHDGRAIRLPVYITEGIGWLSKLNREFQQEFGFDPNRDQLEKIYRDNPPKRPINFEILYEAYSSRSSRNIVSLDKNIRLKDGGESVLSDFIADKKENTEEEGIVNADREIMLNMLSALDERSARIIIKRFGLDGKEPRVLVEIAEEMGIDKERVRQLEVVAVRKLKDVFKDFDPGRLEE